MESKRTTQDNAELGQRFAYRGGGLGGHACPPCQPILTSEEIRQFSIVELQQKLNNGVFTLKTMVKFNYEQQQHQPQQQQQQDRYTKSGTEISLLAFLAIDRDFSLLFDKVVEKLESLESFEGECKLLILESDLNNIPSLIRCGIADFLNESMVKEILIILILSADITRLMVLNECELITGQRIVEALYTPNLIMNAINVMYNKIGKYCRRFNMTKDDVCMKYVCDLERRYINLFRLIKSNGIELSQLCSTSLLIQNVLNTYMYALIKYILEITHEKDYVGVIFYHYSNFPIENKIIMSSIYNDRNLERIQNLLKDKLFIKRIVKKNIGKRIIKISDLSSYHNAQHTSQHASQNTFKSFSQDRGRELEQNKDNDKAQDAMTIPIIITQEA